MGEFLCWSIIVVIVLYKLFLGLFWLITLPFFDFD